MPVFPSQGGGGLSTVFTAPPLTGDGSEDLPITVGTTEVQSVASGDVQTLSAALDGGGPIWNFWGKCLLKGGGGALLSIRPNGLATDQLVKGIYVTGEAAPLAFKDTELIMAAAKAVNSVVMFKGCLQYMPGEGSLLDVWMIQDDGDPDHRSFQWPIGQWTATTAPISVQLRTSVAASILEDSLIVTKEVL